MLVSLSDAAWRAALLFALGLAPYAAPLEALPAPARWVLCARLAIFTCIAVGLTLIVRRAGRDYPWVLLTAVVALLGIPVVAAAVTALHAPLATGTWFAVPLVWGVLATSAAGPGSRLLLGPSSLVRGRWLGGGVAMIGLLSLLAAVPRVGSRDAILRASARANPGSEEAALSLAEELRARGDHKGALEALSRCRASRPLGCACAEGEAGEAIDLARYPDARSALDATPECPPSAHRLGLQAEILIGAGSIDDGSQLASRALAVDPKEPHAAYARAWAASTRGDVATARELAGQAVALGRGTPARLLLGRLLSQTHQLPEARAVLAAILTTEPDNARATYELAIVARGLNDYHEAREGFLHVLRIDPTYADARYQLAALTYSRGALLESKHHVDAFAASFPSDPRVAELRRMLETPPPRRALSVGQ